MESKEAFSVHCAPSRKFIDSSSVLWREKIELWSQFTAGVTRSQEWLLEMVIRNTPITQIHQLLLPLHSDCKHTWELTVQTKLNTELVGKTAWYSDWMRDKFICFISSTLNTCCQAKSYIVPEESCLAAGWWMCCMQGAAGVLQCCSAAVRGGDKDQALSRVLTLAQWTPPVTAAWYLDTAPVIGRIIIIPIDYSVIESDSLL